MACCRGRLRNLSIQFIFLFRDNNNNIYLHKRLMREAKEGTVSCPDRCARLGAKVEHPCAQALTIRSAIILALVSLGW